MKLKLDRFGPKLYVVERLTSIMKRTTPTITQLIREQLMRQFENEEDNFREIENKL